MNLLESMKYYSPSLRNKKSKKINFNSISCSKFLSLFEAMAWNKRQKNYDYSLYFNHFNDKIEMVIKPKMILTWSKQTKNYS